MQDSNNTTKAYWAHFRKEQNYIFCEYIRETFVNNRVTFAK